MSERVRLKQKSAKDKRNEQLAMARLRARASRLYRTPDPSKDGRTGRPTKFNPEILERTKALCAVGATTEQLAEEFQVSTRTIRNWQTHHPEFLLATKGGKEAFDGQVERTLAECALGYVVDVPAVRAMPMLDDQGKPIMDGKKVLTEEVEVLQRMYVPPDPLIALKWLALRRREQWNEKVTIEQTVTHEMGKVERGILEYLLDASAGVSKRLGRVRRPENAKLVEVEVVK